MLDSLANLSTAQAVRSATFPLQLAAPSPTLEWLLESPRERNAMLDAIFYDVGTLALDEVRGVALRYAAEGAILEVGPTDAPTLRMWRDIDEFSDHEGDYAALVVAGVGSSALGSAAFARNVADAAGAKVLAVVSGYGLADLLTEAIGGYFLFGHLNSVRHLFEWMDDLRKGNEPDEAAAAGRPQSRGLATNPLEVARRSDDVRTLVSLLTSHHSFRWLVGHSKGNLVLSEALYAICDEHEEAFARVTQASSIITVSARIAMPRGPQPIIDVMGQLDTFGALNSRLTIPTDVAVPLAWHHTNTELPFHLPVADTLRPLMNP